MSRAKSHDDKQQGQQKQNKIDNFVLQYRRCKKRSQRNKIYTAIHNHYLPKLNTIISQFSPQWHDYIISEYDYYLLQCLERWDETKHTRFTTYWYSYVALKIKSVVQEKYIFKQNRDRNLYDLALSYNYIDNR